MTTQVKRATNISGLRQKESSTTLVVRSEVKSGLPYVEYKQHLRADFFHACAYCTMTEAEAQAIRFTIDHYEPKSLHPELVNEYSNLMYCCDTCNRLKGDRCPPNEARAEGNRFFRPDHDIRAAHFERRGRTIKNKSKIGEFTIEALDLNRESLCRLRSIRERLVDCDRYVVDGLMALRGFKLDRLPAEIRHKADQKIKEALLVADEIQSAIDSVLREYAGSPLVDPDPNEAQRAKSRAEKLKELEAIYPGNWRAPRRRKRNKK